MSRIQLSQPSFANGYARSRGESVAPELWPSHAWVPSFGPTGATLFDLCGNKGSLALTGGTQQWGENYITLDATHYGTTSQLVGGLNSFSIIAKVRTAASDSNSEMRLCSEFGRFIFARRDDVSQNWQFLVYNNSTSAYALGATNCLGTQWNTVCGVFNGSNIYVYVDAKNDAASPVTLSGPVSSSGTELFTVGGASKGWPGDVEYLYLYKQALSNTEIVALTQDPLLPFRRRLPVFYSVSSAGGGTTYQGEAIDGLTLGESTASRGIFGATAIDGIGMGENQSGLLKALLSVSDGIKISELSAGRLSISANGVDGIALSDAASAIAVLGALASDGVSISDTGAGDLGGLIAEALDGFKIGDTASSIAALIANAIDGAAIGDSSSSIASMISVAIDGILLSDNAISGSFEGLAADGFKLTDSSITMLKILQSIADGIAMGDAASTRVDFTITCADGVTFGETIGTIMTMLATASDTFNLGDIAVYLDQQIATITLSTRSPSITFTLRKPTITFN